MVTRLRCGDFHHFFEGLLAVVVVAVADNDDHAARLDGLALNQGTAGAGLVDGIEQGGAAAGFSFAEPLENLLRIVRGVLKQFGFRRIPDQIAREAGIRLAVRLHRGQDEVLDGLLELVPVQPVGVREVDQEADHDGLVAFAGEVCDLLDFTFVAQLKVLHVQIAHEPAFFVGYGDRHNHFADAGLEGFGGADGRLRFGFGRRRLGCGGGGRERECGAPRE
ncbi:MAG: hypothetical protein QM757_10255 [Paludibaculum sp.]